MMHTRSHLHPDTRLIHGITDADNDFEGLSTPVHRASTVLFKNAAVFSKRNSGEVNYVYGTMGTPTSRQLEIMMADNDGGLDCALLPSGLAALALVNLAILKAGDHCLMPDNSYDPNVAMARDLLVQWHISFDLYDPLDPAHCASLIKPNTKLVWVETPGSWTLEVADLPAIAEIAHKAGALVAVDNTWSAGRYLKAFDKGADIAVQAMTKYQGGHADVLMGSVVWRDAEIGKKLRTTRTLIGYSVSSDDCWLMLRGMQTMQLRLSAQGDLALHLAQWLAQLPWVQRVLHPALPSGFGHDTFKRDFSGSSSLFSIVLRADISAEQADAFIDSLQLFGIGVSWAGTKSLALHGKPTRRHSRLPAGEVIRLAVGLEHISDLQNDLAQAAQQAGF